MMRILIFSLLIMVFSLSAQISPKRGIAYGSHSVADITAIHQGASWWYNWSINPDAAVVSSYQSLGIEYVPMFWNATFDVNTAIANIPTGAKYILAFNEPNFTVEANMTPAQAVANWGRIEQVAAARNLQIISAVPAYGSAGSCIAGYTSPITWHDEFFSLCPTCKVDYIAFHCYETTTGGLFALVNNLKKYNRPLWITEFACWDPAQNATFKNDYLTTAVSTFENDPDIYRYAWFTGRRADNTTINLLGASGVLTSLGASYVNAAYGPKNAIPGKIEAEAHYRRRGTSQEATTDAGGGQNIGWTDPGDWEEYLVNVSSTGNYTFQFRVASQTATGDFTIELDGQNIRSNITFAPTGGYQTWTTVNVTGLPLTVGEHLLKLKFNTGGFNINYFTTVFESSLPPSANFSATPTTTCTGNSITFTDLTTNKTGAETYSWNFGAGASPTTANTAGPHTVTYSTGGQKTVSLTVTNNVGNNTNSKTNYITVAAPPNGCLFSDDYNNATVNWLTTGAFSYTESGTIWNITNGGYGEWENFKYTLNDGTNAVPLNFQCAANKPVLKIRAKSSANCLLSLSLVDANGRSIDNYNSMNMELTTSYQTFTIDYAKHFRNYYSANPGVVDSSNIAQLQFAINPGFYSYPIVGSNATYNAYFPGTVTIDWIGIGDNTCQPPAMNAPSISSFTPSCGLAGNTVTISGTDLDNATSVTFNGTAGTIQSNTSTQITVTVPAGVSAGKITVTNGNGSGQSQNTFNLKPVTSAITGNATPCVNATGISYQVTNTIGSSYNWSVPAGASVSSGAGSNAVNVAFAAASGSVSVTETNAAGCVGTAVSSTITLQALPAANAGGDQTVTSNSATLGATGTGTWTVVSGTGTFTSNTTANTSVNGLSTGLNRFRWTTVSGACSNYDDVDITYNSVLSLNDNSSVIFQEDVLVQSIAPNPFTESAVLLVPEKTSKVLTVQIFNSKGQEVFHDTYQTNTSVEIGSTLHSGIYNVIFSDGMNSKAVRVVKR